MYCESKTERERSEISLAANFRVTFRAFRVINGVSFVVATTKKRRNRRYVG